MLAKEEDCFITGYRCHAHMVTRGEPMEKNFSELFGNKDGSSSGKGGSMHMFRKKNLIFLVGTELLGPKYH